MAETLSPPDDARRPAPAAGAPDVGGRPGEMAGPGGPPDEMERLDFTLPDFTRLAWVTDLAERVWRPRLDRIATAWAETEWRAVLAGVRSCAVTMASPEEFLALGGQVGQHGDTGPHTDSTVNEPGSHDDTPHGHSGNK